MCGGGYFTSDEDSKCEESQGQSLVAAIVLFVACPALLVLGCCYIMATKHMNAVRNKVAAAHAQDLSAQQPVPLLQVYRPGEVQARAAVASRHEFSADGADDAVFVEVVVQRGHGGGPGQPQAVLATAVCE
jgi:hypothetical protein